MERLLRGCWSGTFADAEISAPIRAEAKVPAVSAPEIDKTALFRIGYGLYVVTSNDGKKDNGLIVNTVSQVTNNTNQVAVCINKQNYSHHVIRQTGVMNVNCLSVDAPFSVFEAFGFRSGRTVDKFADTQTLRSDNGLVFLTKYINSFLSLKVEQYVDLDTHGMFICSVTEARVISDKETMTYSYYQDNVKPKPQTEGRRDMSARCAVTFMRAMSSRTILYVRSVSTGLPISNR